MTKTKIEWADRVWNPTTGCTKVNAGCKHCYAERIAGRFWGERKFTDVQIHPERLDMPLHWSKPSRVFVNSMSDLFHPDVDEKFIAKVFGIMWLATKHTFMVLTKRPDRMAELLNNEDFQMHTGWFASQAIRELGLQKPKDLPAWPNQNIWLGVSVEDQKAADERIPLLLQMPAAVRFVSAEPLLGDLCLSELIPPGELTPNKVHINALLGETISAITGCVVDENYPHLDWVICGGESGPNARPMHPHWARSLRDDCQAAGVPFFFKQFGEWYPSPYHEKNTDHGGYEYDEVTNTVRFGKRAAGRLLDGREWNQFPEVG